jgi:amino acid adenylation domain-containing protein
MERLENVTMLTNKSDPVISNGQPGLRTQTKLNGESRGRIENSAVSKELIENSLVAVWADVLGRDQIGIDENFFDIGGYSLLAVMVVSRVRDSFHVDLPLRSIFEAPTVAGLASQVLQLLEDTPQHQKPEQSIPRRQPSHSGPLSFAQRRLWFVDQLEPNGTAYNIPDAVRLTGPLDIQVLERCLQEIVRRHEVLRTTFSSVGGEPIQTVSADTTIPLQFRDLSDFAEPEREQELHRFLAIQGRLPFDLSKDLMLRANLVRLAAQEHVLLLTLHHIASDGWSAGILFQELANLYKAFVSSQPSPLPELPVQYLDYALWQRQGMEKEAMEKQLDFWRQHLDGAPAVLELHTDHPRPAVQSHKGAVHQLTIDRELSKAIRALSHKEGTTLFMTLLAALQTLLFRYTGQEDIVVGCPTAGRNRTELEKLIGCFVNSLPIRIDLSENPTFSELLSRVRESTLAALANQDLPFDKLVEELRPARSLRHAPFFQVTFTLQNMPGVPLELANLRVQSVVVDRDTAKFDLWLNLTDESQGLTGWLEYNADLFEPMTICRFAGHLQNLLAGIVADPHQPISTLPLLTKAERQHLLVECNHNTTSYPSEACIHQIFESRAAKAPEAVAIVFKEQQLTYRELNARANQLAHFLRQQGVVAETKVAVCFDRSPEMVVAILAILKAGGAYVPLDPIFPKQRLALMLDDSESRILLTHSSLIDRLPQALGRRICLDTNWGPIACQDCQNPSHVGVTDNLAYVMYTSGSTGLPKGVEISHRAVASLLFGVDYIHFGSNHAYLHLSSLAFDASTFEIWGALLHGARCVLFPGKIPGPTELGHAIAGSNVDTLWLTAALFNTVVDEAPEILEGVQQLLIGGESLSANHVRRALRRLPSTEIINGYGPTEATTFTCCYRIPHELDDRIESIPIGQPLANTEVFVLDERLQPVPLGVSGELHIGGPRLARGYVNRPALTEEKFIPHPFRDGQRLYKTGDKVRRRADGNLEFLGRLDNQIKLRGYRIELGEIEAILSQHPQVRQAAVLLHQDRPDDKQLVAYVVPRDSCTPAAAELRGFLGQKLPDYMVPSTYVAIAALPLTPSGKVDKRALPIPSDHDRSRKQSYIAPRTSSERTLAGIWSDLLGQQSIGVHDNFFECGGHSLLATRVVSRIRNVFDLELPVQSLFELPTVAELAERIDKKCAVGGKGDARLPIAARRDGDPPLSFAQERLWFLDQLMPGSASYNIPSVWRLRGPLRRDALERSLREIVRRHEVLRTTIQARDGKPIQVISDHGDFHLGIADLREQPGTAREREAERWAEQEVRRPFNLSSDLPLRAHLLKLASHDHLLIFTLHHIAFDGWSLVVFFKELEALYSAFAAGEPSPLQPLPMQYADHAVGQRQWLDGEVLERQLTYWRRQMTGVRGVLELSTDHARPEVRSDVGARVRVFVDQQLTQDLRLLSQREGATLFMTLLAAFQTLLQRYCGQTDIVVGCPTAGRNRTELEGLIGLFVNTLPLRTDLSGNPTFQELLGRVREAALGAYEHQDLPFERLVGEVRSERSLGRTPLFQVMFALQNTPLSSLELAELQVQPQLVDVNAAKFDLSLSLTEDAEGLQGWLDYEIDLFEPSTITRLVGHFQTLLRAIVVEPGRRISEFPLLTGPERQQLLVDWNDTGADCPHVCVHELFESQSERSPDAVAVAFGDQRLSYRELNSQANQLAHHLRGLGVGPDTLVAICLERSLNMVVGLLGILKAGGAYVPLDPIYPRERLELMLKDCMAAVLVTEQPLLDKLADHEAKVVCLDVIGGDVRRQSIANPICNSDVANLAYVIYTSGSTGHPKGVAVTHHGLVNYLTWCNATYSPASATGAPVQSSLSFDLTVTSLFGPLLVGRTVYLLPNDRGLASLQDAFRRPTDFSLVKITPSQLDLLGQSLTRQEMSGRTRVFVIGGETLTAHHIAFWQKFAPDTVLVNEYGPTETVVGCCTYRIPTGTTFTGSIPIGRPIANTQVYVLDDHFQPVPIGVPGELFVGGAGVARGYLNKPNLTAERFVPNTFSKDPRARLYRTGDWVRWRVDGNLEFLGRRDHQVKLHGYRIELEEIEAILAQHPQVRQAVVSLRRERNGYARLVAYVVPLAGRSLAMGELRSYLERMLPDYMVPSAFVEMDALPLTPNGKVDRQALPSQDIGQLGLKANFVAPLTPNEQNLATIWAEVLGLRQIGVHDDFFDIGGNSLMAVQLFARIEKQFKRKLPLAMLFQRRTIAGLAQLLAEPEHAAREISLVQLQRGMGDSLPMFLMPSLGGELLHARLLIQHLGKDIGIYGLQPHLAAEAINLFVDFEATAARYVQALREFQPQGRFILAGYSYGGFLAFEVARQLVELGEKVELLAILDTGPSSPTNRPKKRRRKNPLLHFLANLPGWIKEDVIFGSPVELIKRAKRMVRKNLRRCLGWLINEPQVAELHDVFDLYRIPTQNRDLMRIIWNAVRNYVPKTYQGRVTLFRARTSPLFGFYDNDLGWGQFAQQGVDIHVLPGNHENILTEPHVRKLAEDLRKAIYQATS